MRGSDARFVSGRADPDEPTGLLIHHQRHDAECWNFLDQLLSRTTEQVFNYPT
jgi:hypothetical protein